MKKIVNLSILLLLLSVNLSAQTEKGTLVIGSQFQIFSGKEDETRDGIDSFNYYKNNSFNISPQIGYFILTNFEAGLNYEYSYQKYINNHDGSYPGSYDYSSTSKRNIHSFGVFTKYHQPIYRGFGVFGELTLNCNLEKTEETSKYHQTTNPDFFSSTYTKQTGTKFNAALNMGLEYYIKKRFGIELKFGLLSYSTGPIHETITYENFSGNPPPEESDITSSDFRFSPLSISVGFKFNITTFPVKAKKK